MRTNTNVTLRVPLELVKQLDQIVELEAKRTGLRVDRSSIIRRALTQHIEIVRISGKEKDK
jgi:hypothetical protein